MGWGGGGVPITHHAHFFFFFKEHVMIVTITETSKGKNHASRVMKIINPASGC